MKKICAILILALLAALAGCALAETSTVARSGALAAYLDGEGRLYLPGNTQPVNRQRADALVSVDPYRLLFLSQKSDGTRDLYMIDLGSLSERLIAKHVCDACMADEDTLYYVSGADRAKLMRVNMKTLSEAVACTAAEPIDRLYNSAEGLVYGLVDGAGTMILNRLTGQFESYLGALPQSGLRTERFELFLSDGSLFIRDLTSLVSEHIDSGVQAYAVMKGKVYYLCGGGATRLKCYDPVQMTWQVVLTLDSSMERQLTASEKQLFLLDYRGQVYTVDLESGELRNYVMLPDTSTYDLPKGYDVSDIRIEAMHGQLNVYAELTEAAAQPSLSFIEFTATSDSDLPNLRLVGRYAVKGEATAWAQIEPAKQYSPLSRGSRGDAVRAIQKPLRSLGYYTYYIDGIFGPRTEYAIRLLQSDLGRPVTGVADAELQRLILEGKLPGYDAYMALTRGNRGLRVQIMQEKLRDLGYLGDAADGIFGANTQRAVQLFQAENGLDVSDGATRETLKRLYSGGAKRCISFIDLYPGYTGCRVRELNNRLQALYYLEYNPGGSYTDETAEAVRAFQRSAGLSINGNATSGVLRRLFGRYAPECPGYITLRRGDENNRVDALQLRLKKLNYYSGPIDGYYGKSTEKAVKLFQKKLGLNVTGTANVRTQTLLFSKDAPEYVKPTVIGKPVITVERFDSIQAGVYYINENSAPDGNAVFSWYVEGEVKHYNIKVYDADGRVLVNQKSLSSRTAVPLHTLEKNRLYALTVTAYPEDGSKKHITTESVGFIHCENRQNEVKPVGVVGDPQLFIKTVLRTQGGVQYLQPGEAAFHWHADGELDRYCVEIFSSDGEMLKTLETRGEQLSLATSGLSVGKVYTLFVYAIPARGTIENARTAALKFAPEDLSIPTPTPEPEEPDVTPAPLVTLAPTTAPPASAVMPVADGTVPGVEQEQPDPAANATTVEMPEPVPEPAPVEIPEPAPEEVPEPVPEEVAEPVPEEVPEPVPEEIPEPVPEEVPEPAPEEVPEPAPEEVPEPEPAEAPSDVGAAAPGAVTPPALSFETTVEQRDDITYVADDILVMHWQSEGDVMAYYAEVVNREGAPVASATTEDTFIAVRQGNLMPGEVYTLRVTALPADGSEGQTASARFALYQADADEAPPAEEPVIEEPVVEEPPVEEPPAEEPPVEVPPVEEPVVEEPLIEEPVIEEPVIEQPVIEEPVIEEPVIEEPLVEEPPVEEPVIEEPVIEQPPVEEPVIEEPVIEEPPVEEPPFEEPVMEEPVIEEPVIEEPPVEEPPVEAPPVEEPPVEEPPVEEPPVEEPPVEAPPAEGTGETAVAMDPETTTQVQTVLVSWGWLAAEGFVPGVADEPTLLAINAFETWYNANIGGTLTSAEGLVDVNTLAILLNQEGVAYPNVVE